LRTENNPGSATDPVTTGSIPALGRGPRRKDALDTVDRTIISALRANARIPYADLARLVGLSGPSVADRVKRLEQLEGMANVFPGVERSFAIQAGRELRVLVQSREVTDGDATALAASIAGKIEKELQYPGQIKVVVIREIRAVDFAR